MKGKGFSELTEDEYAVLRAFPEDREIAFPVDCGLSREKTVKVLESLKKKDSITGRAPYRLTKKGIKEIREWNQR